MSTLLDVLFSMVLGGVILTIVLGASEIASENQSVYNGDMLVQELLVSTAQLIESEFRNMGYGVPENEASIIAADSHYIAFLVDLDRNGGTIDTIRYFLGDTTELAHTPNELDRFLHRNVNGGTPRQVGVVTTFTLKYIARSGEVLPIPVPQDRLTEIHVVEVTMEVQNPYAILRRAGEVMPGERNALYSSSLWQQTRLASQNTRR